MKNLQEIKNIVDKGNSETIKEVINELIYIEKTKATQEAFDYIIKNTSGSVRIQAFAKGEYYLDRKLYQENLSFVTSRSDRLKILGISKYAYLYPEEFIENWNSRPRVRWHLLRSIPDKSLKKDDDWFAWMEESLLYSLSKVDERVFSLINSTILNCSNDVREEYARAFWADSRVLDQMKDDKHRPVINSLSENPFIDFKTAEYLILKHKTPSIRISIANHARDNELLQIIWESTKSDQIRKAVSNNPHFRG